MGNASHGTTLTYTASSRLIRIIPPLPFTDREPGEAAGRRDQVRQRSPRLSHPLPGHHPRLENRMFKIWGAFNWYRSRAGLVTLQGCSRDA